MSNGFLLGVALEVLGAAIRMACFRALGVHFTYNLSIRDGHKLVRSGPYAIVRHPAYVGSMCAGAGITFVELSAGSWWREARVMDTRVGQTIAVVWGLLLLFSITVLARAPQEDAMLRARFGEEWEAYAREVRWWFVPGLI
ncbi:hypothetical protein K488DRAFT_41409 [Vararia minispora EC-137]|uniref:Uncharacterized protein n=1 Tax=Vararia minispora EC-137 TaxID=1314806 RepID=A0ACB8QXC9_9AGAM|nr:hypothetical protein K488DRAFT_41409 [Vararia minispora EC-137]